MYMNVASTKSEKKVSNSIITKGGWLALMKRTYIMFEYLLERLSTCLIIIIAFFSVFSFSCLSSNEYEWTHIFPNINFTDGFVKMNVGPNFKNREDEVIARSLDGGIQNSRFPKNLSDESYRWNQRSYVWKNATGNDHEYRITCWYISQEEDILIAWIEASLFAGGNQAFKPILFSPVSHKNIIISTLEQMYAELNNTQSR